MTTHRVLLASTFVLAVAAGVSAQTVFVPPGTGVRVVEPTSPFPIVTLPPLPVIPDMKGVEEIVSLAMANAQEKANVVIAPGSGKGSYQIFTHGSSPDQWYSQARQFIERDQYDRAMDPLERVIAAKGERPKVLRAGPVAVAGSLPGLRAALASNCCRCWAYLRYACCRWLNCC